MRRVILGSLVAALLGVTGCGGGSRVLWTPDMSAAQAIATDRNTLVMAVFVKSDDELCKVFEEETLSAPAVLARIREYVPVRLDVGDKQAQALGARLQVPAVPAVVFLRPNADVVHRCAGAMKAAEFLKQLDIVDQETKAFPVPLK